VHDLIAYLLAASEASDLGTWLADLHLEDAEPAMSDERSTRYPRRQSGRAG